MSKVSLGIDIGNHAIHIVVCNKGVVIRTIVEPVPENLVKNGEIVIFDTMAYVLKSIRKRFKIRAREVSMIMPSSLCHLRRVTVPMMTADQLAINLPYEFRDYITQEKDKYFYDYAVVEIIKDQEGKEIEIDLLATVVLKKYIEAYRKMFRQAGFKLVTAIPVEMSYINLLRKYLRLNPIRDDEEKKGTCFVDLGHNNIRIIMFDQEQFIGMRVLDYGCKQIVEAISDNLNIDTHLAKDYLQRNYNQVQEIEECKRIYGAIGVEVMKAINYSSFNNPGWQPQYIHCLGGGSSIKTLVFDIEEAANVQMRGIQRLIKTQTYDKDSASLVAIATGAAIQQGEKLW